MEGGGGGAGVQGGGGSNWVCRKRLRVNHLHFNFWVISSYPKLLHFLGFWSIIYAETQAKLCSKQGSDWKFSKQCNVYVSTCFCYQLVTNYQLVHCQQFIEWMKLIKMITHSTCVKLFHWNKHPLLFYGAITFYTYL